MMTFEFLTPVVYWLLVVIWLTVSLIYFFKLRHLKSPSKALSILLLILLIDAVRTLVESLFFGAYFTSFYGLIDKWLFDLLSTPSILIMPKLFNLAAATLILGLILKFSLPKLIDSDLHAQSELVESEKRLRAAIKYSPNPIFVHSEDGEMLVISDKVKEITGYQESEIKTLRDWTKKVYREKSETVMAMIAENYRLNQKKKIGELDVHTKDGRVLTWDIDVAPIGETSDGRKMHLVTAIDVTAQKEYLNRLKLTEFSINEVGLSIIWLDKNGVIQSCNAAGRKTFAFRDSALQAHNYSDIQPDNTKTSWATIIEQLETTERMDFVTQFVDSNGEGFPAEVSASLIESNEATFICLIIKDITESLINQKAALESETRRQFALDAANIGDWDMDLKTGIATRSLRHDQCFGYQQPVAEWDYETFLSHIHPDDRETVHHVYESAMHEQCQYDVEFRVIWPDKSVHWLWSKGRFYHDKLGNPIRVSGIQVDITTRKKQEETLRLNQAAINAFDNALAISDARAEDMPLVYVNPAFEKMTGYKASEVLGKNCRFLNHHTREEDKLEKLRKALIQGDSIELELLNTKKDGTKFWNQLSLSPVTNDQGQLTHFVGIQKDITERIQRQAERNALFSKLEEQASLLDKAHDAIVVRDLSQKITYWNNSAYLLYGWTKDEVIGKNLDQVINKNLDELNNANQHLLTFGEWRGELSQTRKNGEEIVVDAHWTLVKDDAGIPFSVLAVNTDITQRKLVENEIKHIAYYDGLTDLPNRESLMNYLEVFADKYTAVGFSVSIIFLDLDNFKTLNDTFGHFMGDLLLKDVVKRLKACIRKSDFLARFGGDEFVIVLNERTENFEALKQSTDVVANEILQSIKQPFTVESYEYFSTSSIGVSITERDLDPVESMKRADLAMYQAKKIGKNNIQYFNEELENQLLSKTKIELQLRGAIEHQEFELYLQPQLNNESEVFGCEALIRWNSKSLGIVSPADFIPIAEESTLIIPIGLWVFETACGILHEWEKSPVLNSLSLSINVSANQFKQADFIADCARILNKFSFNRSKLKLELTETVLAENKEIIISQMNEFINLGLVFSLDDFGTGYSSLSYLKSLPLNQLKIDQSFVRDILLDANDAAIAQTIVKLADSLGLEVLAEGVETEEQKNFLLQIGCEKYQGYLFSKPLPRPEMEKLLEERAFDIFH